MSIIVDMHCHVLPGVDDGAGSMDETVKLLKEAVRQGIQAMIVTPHFHPGRYKVYSDQIRESLRAVEREIIRHNIPIELYAGQECYYFSGLVRELEKGEVLTMAGSQYVLVEFDPEVMYSRIQQAVQDLTFNGYKPIIAHYERYQCLNGKMDRLEQLRHTGAMLQINFDRLVTRDTLFKRNPWRKLFKEGYVDFLGSDTHGMSFRPLHVDEAVDWIETDVRPELARRVLERNIRKILENR